MSGRIRVLRRPENAAPHGLPAALPAGETLLWQGAPDARVLARRVLHVRKLGFYFALLAAFAAIRASGGVHPALWFSAVALVVLGALAIALLVGFAFAVAKTTVYTITDRRIVLRIGVALSMDINLPFAMIDGASARIRPDGSGDIPVLMNGATRIGWMMLWPHARPWHTRRVQPMLRAIPDAARVADMLSRALAASAAQSVPAAVSTPVPQPLPSRDRASLPVAAMGD